MCVCGAGCAPGTAAAPSGTGELQRDKYTGATLSAAAQTQVGRGPAVNRDLCLFMRVCVCDIVGLESRQAKGIVKEEGSPLREQGNYARAQAR